NYQKVGKELMSQDEITVMDGGKCIFQLRGVRPFLSDKIDKIVTNRILALPIFALVMFLVYFFSIQTVGTMWSDWVND
ncbi:ferrous iron transport protein B, partial [Streptococcus pyogenes]